MTAFVKRKTYQRHLNALKQQQKYIKAQNVENLSYTQMSQVISNFVHVPSTVLIVV